MEESLPPEPRGGSAADVLLAELQTLSSKQLDRRAAKANIPDEMIDAAEDLIALILEAELSQSGNIKQKLDNEDWKGHDYSFSNWWQHPDFATQVNRLRAAGRIRSSLPDSARTEIPDLYPQLIVLGDGNTGKSTVLNRFAEFDFSPVKNGVCTRRPVRLQLRPVKAENRARLQAEGLATICTIFDAKDQYEEVFNVRVAERRTDETALRRVVEGRAAEQTQQDGTQAAHDRQYINEELVITIEADQMIYFDLLDLPGLHNSSSMPKKMVRHYMNKDTLPHTFVLIFSEHKQGDTQLEQSLAFSILHDVAEELGDLEAWTRFKTERCLGVLTKVDRALESNSKKGADAYNADAAAKLKRSLLCVDHKLHQDKWDWVAVLNPNANEQQENMSFGVACQKEAWFFDELFRDDDDMRELCDISNFRRKLVELYEQFVTVQIMAAAPLVFGKVISCKQEMSERWAWEFEEECYHDEDLMETRLSEQIHELVTIGVTTSKPMSSAYSEVLFRDDVMECFEKCRREADPDAAGENSKRHILGLMANMLADFVEKVHAFAGKFRRFISLVEHIIKVLVFLSSRFLALAEQALDVVIRDRPAGGVPVLASIIACAKSELLGLATMVEELPLLPARYLTLDLPEYLEHAKPRCTTAVYPFGFDYNTDGLVTRVTDAERCKIPVGATIVQINDKRFTLQNMMLEASHSGHPVRFAFSPPGCSIVPCGLAFKWLYHSEHVSREYLVERERFLGYRRAAENLSLTFDEETEDDATRMDFERMQAGHSLVRLRNDDPDWYQPPRYHGARAKMRRAGERKALEGLQVSQPTWCCTEGCSQAHDTAFNPCGHTVCCWECAQTLDRCPVCALVLASSSGSIQDAKDLCYDHCISDAEYEVRVREANRCDAHAYREAKVGYQQLFVLFKAPEDLDAQSWALLAEERRQQLRARPDKIPGQRELWPYLKHMVEERDRCAAVVSKMQQECAEEVARIKKACDEQIVREVARQLQQARTNGMTEMLEYAKELETALSQRDGRVNSTAFKPDGDAAVCQADDCVLRQLITIGQVYRISECVEDTQLSRLELIDLIASHPRATPNGYSKEVLVKLETTKFGGFTGPSRHHCRACGDIFCDCCAPANAYYFASAGLRPQRSQKGKRVCYQCKAALQTSGGVRNRLMRELRPDGTRPVYSDEPEPEPEPEM